MNSSSIPTPKTPFQNNNDECVQTSVGSDLTEPSLDCKPSSEKRSISYDFNSLAVSGAIKGECLDLTINDDESSISTRSKKSYDEVIVKIAESFDKRAGRTMERDELIAKHEKSLLLQTEAKAEGVLLNEASSYEKEVTRCKRRLEQGIDDSEENWNVKFQLRVARKMLKKVQSKLQSIYGESGSDSD